MIAWLLVLVPASLVLWFVAAFALRWGQSGRLAATIFVPAILVAAYLYFDYWTKRSPPAELGWDIFFAIVSLVAGASTAIITLPVWYLAEKGFGRREL